MVWNLLIVSGFALASYQDSAMPQFWFCLGAAFVVGIAVMQELGAPKQ